MATSSIRKNFVISETKQIEKFADAIESSFEESRHKAPAPTCRIRYLKGSKEVKEFMDKRKNHND